MVTRTVDEIVDGIVARNNALWTLLTEGDELTLEESLDLIERAFGRDEEEAR